MVYRSLLVHEQLIAVHNPDIQPFNYEYGSVTGSPISVSILRTSKLVSHEALPIRYGENRFYSNCLHHVQKLVCKISPRASSLIRDLTIYFCHYLPDHPSNDYIRDAARLLQPLSNLNALQLWICEELYENKFSTRLRERCLGRRKDPCWSSRSLAILNGPELLHLSSPQRGVLISIITRQYVTTLAARQSIMSPSRQIFAFKVLIKEYVDD